MNADAFRHLYDYHLAENRILWNKFIVPLSQEQFIQKIEYSVGSILNHVVHMMSVDDAWFSDLRGEDFSQHLNPTHFHDRDKIRACWNDVEQKMRDYLSKLQDDMLFTKPLSGEDADLILWQILLHVANHGTDHRAQLRRLLYDVGVETPPQDYVFYAYGHSMRS